MVNFENRLKKNHLLFWEIETTSLILIFYFRKKEYNTVLLIHLVELDELFPKIWVPDHKTACGRCSAYAKVENPISFMI